MEPETPTNTSESRQDDRKVGGDARLADGMRTFVNAWVRLIKSRGAVVALGFAIAGVFIVLTAHKLEWSQVTSAFRNGVWLPWLPLAVATYVLGMLVRGLRLQWLVKEESTLTTGTATNIITVGYLTNNILPLRLGEFARAGMLAERTGLSYTLSLTITFLERLLDGLVILFLFVAGSLLIPVDEWMRQSAGLLAIIFAAAILVVAFVTLSPQSAIGLTSNLTSWLGRRWHHKALGLVTQINRGFACLRDAKSALLVLSSSFLVWLLEAAFFMLVMPCFGLPLGFIRSVVTMSFTNLGILIPSSPGYVGVYHKVCQESLMAVSSVSGITPGTLTTLTIDPATAFSYAVVVHFVFFATVTLWGIFAVAKYGLEVGATTALTWEARPIGTLPDERHQDYSSVSSVIISYPRLVAARKEEISRFWSAICECFLPDDLLDDEDRQVVNREVAIFTFTQIECVPFRYKVLFKIGLIGLKVYIFLASGRFLCDVPLAKRRALIEGWAFGKIALTRKFMKLIRSLAVLSYFDHPLVVAALEDAGKKESQPE